MVLLLVGCLFDRNTYEARLLELTDNDGDGWSEVDGDCDDHSADVHPRADELCNDEDDDCDGRVDEAEQVLASTWYPDGDGDGHGGGDGLRACVAPEGFIAEGGDCDDGDDDVHPGAVERCNDADDDCDGTADEAEEVETRTWFVDDDGDGWGGVSTIESCADPGGASLESGDCDDADPDVNPGVEETCDGTDNDCNGAVDDAPAVVWYLDRDDDSYGDDATTYLVCSPPPGYAVRGGDCDDLDATRSPGALEVCEDGIDADCDGLEDPCGIPRGTADGDDASAVFAVSSAESYVARTLDATDLDGDGFDDLLVARGARDGYRGAVAIVPGREALYLGDHSLESEAALLTGGSMGGAFGFAMDAGADGDGDGTGDLLVSALYEDRVYLFHDGAAVTGGGLSAADADVTFQGVGSSASFGVAVALLGDVDGDGLGDTLIGDYLYGSTGAAFLYYGTATGGTVGEEEGVGLIETRANTQLGQEVAALGDIDSDGLQDFFVGENIVTATGDPNYGFLFTGDASRGLASVSDATTRMTQYGADGMFAEVVPLGDFDRDGADDFAIGAPESGAGEGAVYLFLGQPVLPAEATPAGFAEATWSGTRSAAFGASIGSAGDVDLDGYVELAVAGTRSGAATDALFLFAGSASPGGVFTDADAWLRFEGANTEAEGSTLPGPFDLNGDSAMDLAFGAWSSDTAQGEAWLTYGAPR